jgi:uncharacterized protein YndB with AHSA1/START domain
MLMTDSKKAVVTLPTDTQILITRKFAAPKDLVYKAWTTPELIKRRWSAKRGEVTVADVDLRVGGMWRFVMVTDGGFEVAFHGEYREIVPNERIVCTEVYEGLPNPDNAGALNTITFSEVEGRTTLTLLVQHKSREDRDAHINSGMEAGMQDAFDLLEEVASSLRSAGVGGTNHVTEDQVLHAQPSPTKSRPMLEHGDDPLQRLEPFLGAWTIQPIVPNVPPTDVGGRVTFEWLPGGGFLVERWEVPFPGAPNGIAVIGFHRDRGTYLQHYFDARGVARVYEMGFAGGVWTLSRSEADFSPLDFRQRWTGSFSPDGNTITGRWETCHDGTTWEHDFDLRYERIT